MLRLVKTRRSEAAKRGFMLAEVLAFSLTLLLLMPLMAHAMPTITGFTPHSGPVGTSVTVVGTEFGSVTSVQFGSVVVPSFTKNATGTEISTKVPAGAVTGKIYVLSPNGNAATGDNFTVTTGAAPIITGFTPHSGPVGTSVVVVGTNLGSVTSVQFGSVVAASFTVNSAGTEISTKVPAGAVTGKIYVLSPNGNAATGDNFTVTTAELPALNVNNAPSVNEGSAALPGLAEFHVTLSKPSTQTVTVVYHTTNNTALSGSDYTAKSETLTFAPGEISKTVKINFIGDDTPELNETFFLDLQTPTNATIADGRGVGTLRNDDGPTLNIFDAVPTDEGNSATHGQVFIVRLSAASTNTITVHWKTANDSANLDDYVAATGTLTFAPGQTSKLIEVQVRGDTVAEPNETYKVYLYDPAYAVFGDALAIGTIRNDDAMPLLLDNDQPSS